jgi:phage replication O-like protein O
MKIPAPNFTQTPNDLFDHWLPRLGEAELKVLLVIMRKTFGWHKTHDEISCSQLARITGMREETVVIAARSLQDKGVINREVIGPKGKQKTIYSLVINEDSNKSYPSDEPRGPLGITPPGSTEAQKKAPKKETIYIEPSSELMIEIGDFVEILASEYDELIAQYGADKFRQTVDDINAYCAASKPEGYKNYVAAVHNFIKRRNPQREEQPPIAVNEWHSDKYTAAIEYGLLVVRAAGGYVKHQIPAKNTEAILKAFKEYEFNRVDDRKSKGTGSPTLPDGWDEVT